jgi:hypothetical protein
MKTFQLIRTTSFYLFWVILNGCSAIISQQISVSSGTSLVFPKPHHNLIPTVKIAPKVVVTNDSISNVLKSATSKFKSIAWSLCP